MSLYLYEDSEGNVYKRLILQCYSYKLNIVDFFFVDASVRIFQKTKRKKKNFLCRQRTALLLLPPLLLINTEYKT